MEPHQPTYGAFVEDHAETEAVDGHFHQPHNGLARMDTRVRGRRSAFGLRASGLVLSVAGVALFGGGVPWRSWDESSKGSAELEQTITRGHPSPHQTGDKTGDDDFFASLIDGGSKSPESEIDVNGNSDTNGDGFESSVTPADDGDDSSFIVPSATTSTGTKTEGCGKGCTKTVKGESYQCYHGLLHNAHPVVVILVIINFGRCKRGTCTISSLTNARLTDPR